jgi:large subunit ribosomal protein L17
MPSARKLGRRPDHRRAMLRGMVTLLLDKGRIETTVWRAKELKRVADKMITIGKKNTLAAKSAALAYITKEDVVKKLFDQIAPSFEGRNGGYTRVLKLGPRRGDGAEMAIIELVNFTMKEKGKKAKDTKAKKDDKKDDKKEDKKETKDTKAKDTKEVKKDSKDTKKTPAKTTAKEPKKVEKTEKIEKVIEIVEEAEELIAEEIAEVAEKIEEIIENAAEEIEVIEEIAEEIAEIV